MKTDRRVRYTKQVIKDSYLELLAAKPAHKITVKELCEKADINRATFYSHYMDIYDLSDALQDDAIKMIKESAYDSQSNNKNIILSFLESLKDADFQLTNLLFQDSNSKFFIRLFTEFKSEILVQWANEKSSLNAVQQDYFFTFLASGCASIIRIWVVSGMKESAEEISDLIVQLIQYYKTFKITMDE